MSLVLLAALFCWYKIEEMELEGYKIKREEGYFIYWIYSELNGNWTPFRKGINYNGFLIFKKSGKFIRMKTKKKSKAAKWWGEPIEIVKGMPDLSNDPVLIRKREEAVEALRKNPPPEWLLKRMRGED